MFAIKRKKDEKSIDIIVIKQTTKQSKIEHKWPFMVRGSLHV